MSSFNLIQNIFVNPSAKKNSHGSQRRWLWYSVLGFFLFDGLAILNGLLFSPNIINGWTIISDINNTLGWLIGIIFCISRLPRSWWKRGAHTPVNSPLYIVQQKITFCIVVVFFINTIQYGAYAYHDMMRISLGLDWPSIFALLRYPFLLLSILSLYRHPLSFITRLRLAFDGLLVLTALVTFSWYFLLGPIILGVHHSVFEKMVMIANPLSDLILCFYLFQLSFRDSEPAFRVARRLFLFGLMSIVIADLFDLSPFQVNSVFFLLQNVILGLGYILIAFAVQDVCSIQSEPRMSVNETSIEEVTDTRASPLFLWQSFLPSAFVPAVLLFMVIIWSAGRTGPLALGVYLAGIALIILLVLRQILVMYETFVSNRALQRIQKELHEKNLAMEQANHRLEEQTGELATAYEQQRHANELKDQFLLNVNHELRTPLTEMHGYLELLQHYQQNIDAKTYERFLSHALNGSQELLRLVDTILDALRSEHARDMLHSEEVSVTSVVQEAVEFFDAHTREEYQLDLAVPVGLTIYADRQYLRQVLSNLLSNAFKYSPPQTKIVIGVQEVPGSSPCIDMDKCSQIHFWVQDYGPGIPPDSQAFLFTKLFRLAQHQTSAIRGIGLGLYICKQLVEAMDGRIWVESSGVSGEGCRFYFTIPSIHS